MDYLKQKWHIDSDCSKHMAGDASKFIYTFPKNSEHVIYRDNNKGKTIGVGKIGTVATCPFAGERGRGSWVRFPKEERCAESPSTFI